jgi:hypothetical protein
VFLLYEGSREVVGDSHYDSDVCGRRRFVVVLLTAQPTATIGWWHTRAGGVILLLYPNCLLPLRVAPPWYCILHTAQDILGVHISKSSILHEMLYNMKEAVQEQGVNFNALGVGLISLSFLIMMKFLAQASSLE